MKKNAIEINALTLKVFKHGYGKREYIKKLAPWIFRFRNTQDNNSLIDKDYILILENITFSITKNQCFGILNDNVISTVELQKILLGIMKPEDGSICVHGEVSFLNNPASGFVNSLTVLENIYVKAALHRIAPSLIKHNIDNIIDFAGLNTSLLSSRMEHLEANLKKQLGFSIIMCQDSDIYIINEHTNFGEAEFSKRAVKRIIQLGKKKTVIIMSRNRNKIKKFCTNMISIESGKMAYCGEVKLYEKD